MAERGQATLEAMIAMPILVLLAAGILAVSVGAAQAAGLAASIEKSIDAVEAADLDAAGPLESRIERAIAEGAAGIDPSRLEVSGASVELEASTATSGGIDSRREELVLRFDVSYEMELMGGAVRWTLERSVEKSEPARLQSEVGS